MSSLMHRLKRRFIYTKNNFSADKRFSLRLAFFRLFGDITGRMNLKRISKTAYDAKDRWILNYLKKHLQLVIENYKYDASKGTYLPDSPIWVCWWTGENTAPPLVKKCIESIKINSKTRPVIFIDKDNYIDYLSIPSFIIEKVESKQICLANFSDYLRVSLLEKYGGLWLDSTIFCSALIPQNVFDLPFFTCKSAPIPCNYISRMRWTAFVMGGWQHNIFFKYMKSAFELYWSTHTASIDYLLVDYLIELGYENIDTIKQLINEVPLNNPHRDDLQAAMNKKLDASKFRDVINKDTILYKLSWRETYSLTTDDNKESIYAYYLRADIGELQL